MDVIRWIVVAYVCVGIAAILTILFMTFRFWFGGSEGESTMTERTEP